MLQSSLPNFWFCLHPDCPKRIIGPFDPTIVKLEHLDHQDKITNFKDSHEKLRNMEQTGELKSPQSLKKEVKTLVDELNKKFSIYLSSFEETFIKQIQIGIDHRYELYEALVNQNEQQFFDLQDRIGELGQVQEYINLYNSLSLLAKSKFSKLEQFVTTQGLQQAELSQQLFQANQSIQELNQECMRLREKNRELTQSVENLNRRLLHHEMPNQIPIDWQWERGQYCVIRGSKVTGGRMGPETNCLIAPGFRANEQKTIRLRYLVNRIIYNVQLVDVATRQGLQGRVQQGQGTYAFGSSNYLDKDTMWGNENYLENKLIRPYQDPEEVQLTYDGITRKVTLKNLTNQASFSLRVNYPPETILQFAVSVFYDNDWFEIIS